MKLIENSKIPYRIDSATSFEISVNSEYDQIYFGHRIEWVEGAAYAVVLVFRGADGQHIDDGKHGFGISRKYDRPFFYLNQKSPRIFGIRLPKGTEILELHVINWSGIVADFYLLDIAFKRSLIEQALAKSTANEDLTQSDSSFSKVTDQSTEFYIAIEGQKYYDHQITLDAQGEGHIGMLLPRFYDEGLRLIDEHDNKFSSSETEGEYAYLSAGENQKSFFTPQDAQWYGYQIKARRGKSYSVRNTQISVVGLPRQEQVEKLNRELEWLENCDPKRLFLIYTGTTRIGEAHRGNRSMMLAIELAELGFFVVYVYYRSRDFDSILSDQVEETSAGGKIVQLPNDLLTTYSERLINAGSGSANALLSVPDAGSLPLLNQLKNHGWNCAYEARDDWEEFARVDAARWYEPNFERVLSRDADFSISVSPPLREKLVSFGAKRDKSHILPNGAGQLFHEYLNQHNDPVRDEKTIGYFGHLTTQWFDWDALENLADSRKDLTIEIIGHGRHPAIKQDNIKLLGPKSHAEIIHIAARWSLGMIPFVPGRLANAVDPIKVYEYLCLGLPVVSIFMEQIAQYPNVYLYSHSDELVEAVEKSLNQPFDSEVNASFCESASWKHRTQDLVDLFSRYES